MSNQLKELIRVSMRYISPQVTDKAREKGRTGKKLTRYIMSQYLFAGLTFILIYGLTMLAVDFNKFPGIFTSYIGIFTLLGISQSVSIIYNVFFESKDLAAYLPLPFKQSQIFIAKTTVVALSVVPYMLPLFVLFTLAGIRAGVFIPLALIWGLLLFILINVIELALASIVVFGLTRTQLFKKHKKMMTTAMLWVTMAIAVAGILLMQTRTTGGITGGDSTKILPFMPFYYAVRTPFSLAGLGSLLGVILVAGALVALIYAWLLPKLYEQLTEVTTSESNGGKKRHTEYRGLAHLLRSYNLELMKNPNLITQVMSSTLIFPLVMAGSLALNGDMNFAGMPLKMMGVFFVAGYVIALMTINQISFIGNLISLDGENFEFVSSLPISTRYYLKQKFKLGFTVQAVIGVVVSLICGLLLRVPLIHILMMILGSVLGAFVLSLLYFARDYRLLMTNWTNINQLFTRGSGRIGSVFVMMFSWFGGLIAVFVYGFAALSMPAFPLNVIVIGGLLMVSGLLIWYMKTSFWDQAGKVSWQRRIAINKAGKK